MPNKLYRISPNSGYFSVLSELKSCASAIITHRYRPNKSFSNFHSVIKLNTTLRNDHATTFQLSYISLFLSRAPIYGRFSLPLVTKENNCSFFKFLYFPPQIAPSKVSQCNTAGFRHWLHNLLARAALLAAVFPHCFEWKVSATLS